MKIFYICDLNLEEENGGKTHVVGTINSLRELGHRVILFAPKTKKHMRVIKPDTKYLFLINKPVIRSVSYNFILFFYLLYKILKGRPDIIYARQSGFLVAPTLLSKLFSVPYVTEINGILEEEMRLRCVSFAIIKLTNIVEKICYTYANKIITTEKGIKKYIAKKYEIPKEKIFVIRGGTNTTLFKPKNKENAKKILGLKKNYFYLGYTGILSKWQGLEYIIKSMKFVLKKIPNVKFIIVGDGPEKEKLENLTKKLNLQKNIIFIGAVPYHDVPKYINAFDICIAYLTKIKKDKGPSFKVYEYLSCGKPVIVSDAEGDAFKNAVVVSKAENSKNLADNIIRLIKDKQLRERLGRKGRSFILNGHSWKDVAYKTYKVLKIVKMKHEKSI